MKYIRKWPWENTWFLYSFFAYLTLPWCLALASVPDLAAVYREAGGRVVFGTVALGCAWGVGVVLYGAAVTLVGLALSSVIILGLSIALGSLVPFLLLDAARMLTPAGLRIALADGAMLLSVALCARAGDLRDRSRPSAGGARAAGRSLRGILLCVLSGCLSPLLNVAFTLGAPISQLAAHHGAGAMYASNALWSLAVSAGSAPSLLFCAWKLSARGTWRRFLDPVDRGAWLCPVMGGLFFCSTVLYGMGAGALGGLGPVVGWPVYISAIILANNFWGWFTREWQGVTGWPVRLMITGVSTQILAIAFLALRQE